MSALPNYDDLRQDIAAELLQTSTQRDHALRDTLPTLRAAELSFVPLRGDHAATYQDAKRPTIAEWEPFQRRRPTVQEVQAWLDSGGVGGWGLLTGEINRLICLDFDTDTTWRAFLEAMPAEITGTYIERTPSNRHVWLRLPQDVPAPPTMFITGGELRGEGAYTVLAPMTWRGQCWRVESGDLSQIRTLTLAQYTVLLAWYESQRADAIDPGELTGAPMTAGDMRTMYHALTCGRNRALYLTAYAAHCRGNTADDVEAALLNDEQQTFVKDAPRQNYSAHNHQPENDAQRQREGKNTINSAFKRPRQAASCKTGALPNVIREALLNRNRVHFGQQFARFYETMINAGYAPGQTFCEACAVAAVKDVMGRGVVLNALKASYQRPPTASGAASPDGDLRTPLSLKLADSEVFDPFCHSYSGDGMTEQEQCSCTVTKRIKNSKGGRPAGSVKRVYALPTIGEIGALMGIEVTASAARDALPAAALNSAAGYRRALHKSRIEGRPGRYSARMLAGRLGVDRRTIYRYNHDPRTGVYTAPQFEDVELRHAIVDDALPDDTMITRHSGIWLEDDGGGVYAPYRAQARVLLASGRRVWLVRRQASYYATDPAQLPSVRSTAAERAYADGMAAAIETSGTTAPGSPPTRETGASGINTHNEPKTPQNANLMPLRGIPAEALPFAEVIQAEQAAKGHRVIVGKSREVSQ